MENVVVVDEKDKILQPELKKVLPEDKGRAVKAMSQQATLSGVSVESDQLEEEEEEEEEKEPILSEDEVCGGFLQLVEGTGLFQCLSWLLSLSLSRSLSLSFPPL